MNRPKKCPKCNSTKICVTGAVFYCRKCGFINKEIKTGLNIK